ncbi:MAG: class II glutamine amidotransferase [Rhodoferax sp.]|nr:class II glutamine amidotransferase [Rhodoferax sp.]
MCELFAMSTRVPSTITLSLEEFSRHGGQTGPHKDGWGIAWYEQGDVHLLKEATSASTSRTIQYIKENPFHSALVLCHIRKATQGDVASRNCQPSLRELGGVWHSFAHNGNLKGLQGDPRFTTGSYQPVGETDSEYAFCVLLGRMETLWRPNQMPSYEARLAVVQAFAADLRELGPANFLYSDGEVLFAHAHQRHQSDDTIRAPGLWRLARHCAEGGVFEGSGLQISARGSEQDVVLIASVPLSHENWQPLAEGAVIAVRHGREL